MSLANTLLGDISSDDESDIDDNQIENTNDSKSMNLVQASTSDGRLAHIDNSLCHKYMPMLKSLQNLVAELNSEVSFTTLANKLDLITKANEILGKSRDCIRSIHTFTKIRYKPIWSDLDTLIPNPINFAKVIMVVKDDIDSFSSKCEELSTFL